MSIIKSIKQVLGLSGTASENHFWDGSVPNQLVLKRGTPEAPGAELIKALNGVLSFPNQGQSLAANGYVKLPGGLIVQWGSGSGNGLHTISWPTPFATSVLSCVGDSNATGTPAGGVVSYNPAGSNATTGSFISWNSTNGAAANVGYTYIAIGY